MLVAAAGMYLNLGSKMFGFIVDFLKTSACDSKARVQELGG
jgi:hypothetical protein